MDVAFDVHNFNYPQHLCEILWPLHLGWLLVLGLYMEVYIFMKFSMCLLLIAWLEHCGKWEGWALKPWMAFLSNLSSQVNPHVIERFCGIFVLLWLYVVCRLGVFFVRMHQISSLSLSSIGHVNVNRDAVFKNEIANILLLLLLLFFNFCQAPSFSLRVASKENKYTYAQKMKRKIEFPGTTCIYQL